MLTGTWAETSGKKGTFTFTMNAGGHAFGGDWAYDAGGCGIGCGWSGTCIGGLCAKNGGIVEPSATVEIRLTYSVDPADSPGPGRVFVGSTVQLEATATPSLFTGQKIVIAATEAGKRPTGRGVTLKTCKATRICTYDVDSKAVTTTDFRAFVIQAGAGPGGTDVVAETPVLEISWEEPKMRVSLEVKASTSAGLASSARVASSQAVLLVAAVEPRLAEGAYIAVLGRPASRPGAGTLARTCYATPCYVGRRPAKPGTFYFKAYVLRGRWRSPGMEVLAASRVVSVAWVGG